MATEFQTKSEYEAFLEGLLEEYPDTPLTDWPSILIQTHREGETPTERFIDHYGGGPITLNGEEYNETILPENIIELHNEDAGTIQSEHLNSRAADYMRKDLHSLDTDTNAE